MTTEEAIAWFEMGKRGLTMPGANAMYEKAIAALRDQQEREKNEPLTLEELREMGGEPYWHVGLRQNSPPPHWNVLDSLCARHIEDYEYGELWLAYRSKPKEGI